MMISSKASNPIFAIVSIFSILTLCIDARNTLGEWKDGYVGMQSMRNNKIIYHLSSMQEEFFLRP